MRDRGALGALLVLALLASPAPAEAEPVIPPGFESHFAGLLGEAPLPGDWTVESIRIERSEVRYELSREDARALLVVIHPSAVTEGPLAGSYGEYALRAELLEGEAAEPLRTVFVAVGERLEARGEESPPWVESSSPEVPRRDEVSDPGAEEESWSPRLYGALAGALALLFVGWGLRRRLRGQSPWPWVVAGGAMALVVAWAWTADDAYISYRYLHHLLHGEGLVFNPGERVQGFTHPGWLLLLAGPAALIGPVDASLLVGIAVTALTVVLLLRLAERLALGPAAQVGLLVALFVSESFVAFQTSGLETALTHLWLVGLLLAAHRLLTEEAGASLLFATTAGLALTRLDAALVAAPFVVGAIRDRGFRPLAREGRAGLVLGGLALLGWLAFATLYYGFPLPNTFYAKTGEPLPIGRGLAYLLDFAMHEPLSAALLLAGLVAAFRGGAEPRDRWARRCGIAALLHLAYVVWVGGDYMRGRFLVTPYLLSQLALFVALERRDWSRRALVPLLLLGPLAFAFGSRAHEGEVINERAFHPESKAWNLGRGHRRPNRMAVELPPEPTLAGHVMASAYTSDPRLRWIDGHGLTDAFIARCPSLPDPRAGHVRRRIPRAYFESRGDIRLLEDGEARMLAEDPSLSAEVAAMREGASWPTEALERRHEEIRLLTSGPIFAPERLALIPRYTFTRASIEVGDVDTHMPPP